MTARSSARVIPESYWTIPLLGERVQQNILAEVDFVLEYHTRVVEPAPGSGLWMDGRILCARII